MGLFRSLGVAIVFVAASGAQSGPTSTLDSVPPTTSDAAPSLEVRPELTDFDRVELGEQVDRTVRIVNLGTDTVTLGDVEVVGEGFTLVTDNCSGLDIERDDGCAVTVVFSPPEVGTFGGRVQITEPTVVAGDLTGTGVAPSTVSTTTVSTTTTGTTATTTEAPATTTFDTTPPPDTLPGAGEDLAERLAQCEADAAQAQVRFAPALTMVVGEITDIDVVAAIGASEFPAPPDSGPPVTLVPAVLRCEVEATLRGQGFAIDPADAQPGSFIDQPVIAWTWQVTPTSTGSRTLQFRILPVARSGDIRLPGSPVLFEATIAVVAAPRSFIQRVDDTVRGVVGHPLVTGFGALAGVAAALAAGWRWILKRPWPWRKRARRGRSRTQRRPPRRRPR